MWRSAQAEILFLSSQARVYCLSARPVLDPEMLGGTKRENISSLARAFVFIGVPGREATRKAPERHFGAEPFGQFRRPSKLQSYTSMAERANIKPT